MTKLYIVRHAPVNIDFSVPSSQWEISQDGIRATRDLVSQASWHEIGRIYHSPEPKAEATARVISEFTGIPAEVRDELCELQVPTIHPFEEFVRRVGAYLEGFPDPGFEDWDQATSRIVHCVDNLIRDSNGTSAAMVSHGRILAVLFSHFFQRRMTVQEWQSIQLPDLSVVDIDTWTVDKGFFRDCQLSS